MKRYGLVLAGLLVAALVVGALALAQSSQYVRRHATGSITEGAGCGGDAITMDDQNANVFYCNGATWHQIGTGMGMGNLVVQDIDGTPNVPAVAVLQFDQADGFAVSTPGAGIARIDFTGGGGTVGPGTVNQIAMFTPDTTHVGDSAIRQADYLSRHAVVVSERDLVLNANEGDGTFLGSRLIHETQTGAGNQFLEFQNYQSPVTGGDAFRFTDNSENLVSFAGNNGAGTRPGLCIWSAAAGGGDNSKHHCFTVTSSTDARYVWPSTLPSTGGGEVLTNAGGSSLDRAFAWTSLSGLGGAHGTGTTGHLARWTASDTVGDSSAVETSSDIRLDGKNLYLQTGHELRLYDPADTNTSPIRNPGGNNLYIGDSDGTMIWTFRTDPQADGTAINTRLDFLNGEMRIGTDHVSPSGAGVLTFFHENGTSSTRIRGSNGAGSQINLILPQAAPTAAGPFLCAKTSDLQQMIWTSEASCANATVAAGHIAVYDVNGNMRDGGVVSTNGDGTGSDLVPASDAHYNIGGSNLNWYRVFARAWLTGGRDDFTLYTQSSSSADKLRLTVSGNATQSTATWSETDMNMGTGNIANAGTVTATSFSGPLTGNASTATTATSLAVNGTASSSNVADGGTAYYFDTDNTFSSGKLVTFANHSTEKFSVDYAGTARLGAITCISSPCLTDTNVSDTLTASIFKGSGSTTNAVDLATAEAAGTLADARFPALTGDVTTTAGTVATTIAANAVALGTDTTGNYAAGDAEAGNALVTNALDTTGASVDVSAAAPPSAVPGMVPTTTSAAAATWQWGQPMQVMGRRFAFAATAATSSTLFSGVGMSSPTGGGTASAQVGLANRYYVQYASGAVAGAQATAGAGHFGPYSVTRPGYRPRYATIVGTDSAITTRRVWVGLTESTLFGLACTAGSAASGIDFVGACFDTAVAANWQCCSGDGTNYTCSDTGIPVTVSTEWAMLIDWKTAGTLNCLINGTNTVKTTNLSTAAVDIGPYNALETLDNTSRNHQIAGAVYLDQN